MNELSDFLKAISEGKKHAIETNPGKKALKTLEESLHSTNPFLTITPEVKSVTHIEPIVEQQEVVGEFVLENGTFTHASELNEVVVPEVKPAAEQVPMDQINKYLARNASFQQPDPDKVDPTIRAVQDKLKFLEQSIGRIAATGPGSGEVNFRWLDDVERSTMNPANNNWLLEYDSASKKVQFTEDIGPIRTIKLNTAGPQTALVPGQIAWNPEEDCLDIRHSDGTTLQTGLEQHLRVHNHTASTITNGTVVMFAGVENTNEIAMPIIGKYLADSSASPLFLIGVLTSDIAPNAVGRATTFGYVRNLNTTGSDVGETWLQGDLLWAHPTQAGKMTKVRPSAPNVATSIAAVARVSATDGQLLVRPTIWPRLYYGDWYDLTNQTAALANTAYAVKLGGSGDVSGFQLVNGTDIKALNAGRYNFEFSLQVTSSNSSLAKIYIWYRKNGVDVPNSATVITVRENGGKAAPAWNFPVLMSANDTFTLMWATDSVNVSIAHEAATSFCPAIPSVILTVAQTNL